MIPNEESACLIAHIIEDLFVLAIIRQLGTTSGQRY